MCIRDSPGNLVDDLVAEARTTSSLALVVPVEGTREKGDYWKSGFYRIASEADIPIVPSFLDGPTRTGGYGPTVIPSGDLSADMDKFRAFYADKRGVKPVSYTHLRAHETVLDLVCRLLLENKKTKHQTTHPSPLLS